MATSRINEARLRLIKNRQWTLAWGKDYVPAQWATPREAPGSSTATILCPKKVGGRPFHLMSHNETWVALPLSIIHVSGISMSSGYFSLSLSRISFKGIHVRTG